MPRAAFFFQILYFPMKLATLLTTDQVMLDLKGETCNEVIPEIIDHLVFRDMLSADLKDEVVSLLKAREDEISTGIGSGVAIPHAFSDNVDKVTACFARSSMGVDFEALDNAPVNFIVLFVVPKKDYGLHLQTLAAIAKMFNNCEVRQRLQEAETAAAIIAIFSSRPARTR